MARSIKMTSNRRSVKKIKSIISGVIAVIVAGLAAIAFMVDGEADGVSDTPVVEASAPAQAPAAQGSNTQMYRDMLDSLDIKGRAPSTGYERAHFGKGWLDDVSVEFGHNGCDTRNDILRRDLLNIEVRENTKDCIITHGTLIDPFSGETIDFERGERSSEVQIDHLVPLNDAWVKGAQQWDEEKRRNFANDPDNLMAVKGSLNQQKGAGDAATWLPPLRSFRCEYAQKIITVKDRYGVWVTAAEATALHQQLDTCRV